MPLVADVLSVFKKLLFEIWITYAISVCETGLSFKAPASFPKTLEISESDIVKTVMLSPVAQNWGEMANPPDSISKIE